MTFEAREASFNEGQPLVLAFFSIGSWTLRVCASDTAQTFNGGVWQPWPIGMPNIVQSGELKKNDLTIKVPIDFPISQMWMESPPAGTVLCILYDAHLGEAETRDSWTGHVTNVRWPTPASAEILLSSGLLALRQPGLRQIAQRSCRHGIYTPGCGVDPADFATAATVTAAGGNWIEATEFAGQSDGYFVGGFVKWISVEGIPDFRHVRAHVGNRLTLAWTPGRMPAGTACTAHPGCDETPDHCGPRFNNQENYGGLWWLKTKNPFGGDPIY